MTRILVQRGSAGSSSSSNQNRPSTSVPPVTTPASSSSSSSSQHQDTENELVVPSVTNENVVEVQEQLSTIEISKSCADLNEKSKGNQSEDLSPDSLNSDDFESDITFEAEEVTLREGVEGELRSSVLAVIEENDEIIGNSFGAVNSSSSSPPPPPPPPVPPPMPSPVNSNSRRFSSSESNTARIGSSRRVAGWPGVSMRSSPTGSRPSSPRSYGEGEGYNSADEQSPCFSSSHDAEREHQFEIDLRRVKGFEVRKMVADGNCLFRAVGDQVYGDSELYDLVRQMCIDYMERERDHFSQFITEGFTTYCKRKRRDKVYGNNTEIQAMSEMYNRPIHIYSYSTEPINIFHGNYNTDTPAIRLSYHQGNHYNSLVDPRRLTVGAGLGFSSLQGRNVDKDQVKAAIKAQQDQQIDNALLAEGRFYSDLELTEKEIERMVMEASRAEYHSDDKFKQLGRADSLTSKAEPSSSAARNVAKREGVGSTGSVLNESMRVMLSMGFSYMQVVEAYSIFGDDVDSMVCYLLETSSGARRKGKATE